MKNLGRFAKVCGPGMQKNRVPRDSPPNSVRFCLVNSHFSVVLTDFFALLYKNKEYPDVSPNPPSFQGYCWKQFFFDFDLAQKP